MNSLNTGKQNINLDWYHADQNDRVLLVKQSKPSLSDLSTPPSQIPIDSLRSISSTLRDNVESSQPLPPSPHVALPRIPLNAAPLCHHVDTPSEHSSHSNLHQVSTSRSDLGAMREFVIDSTLTPDILLPAPRMEPGRIRKEVRFDFSSPLDLNSAPHAHKHPYISSAPITPELIPLKRQRMTPTKAQSPKSSSLLTSDDSIASRTWNDTSSTEQLTSDPFSYGNNYRDINTIANSDLVDFYFTNKKFEDIDRLEDEERRLRMKQGADAVLTGKMFDIQKEFMTQLMKRSSKDISERASETVSGVMQSVLNYKNSLIERATGVVDSAKDTLNMTSIHRSLDAIALESKFKSADSLKENSLHTDVSERIVFAWPRQVPKEIYEAEELARSERIQRGADPMITGRLHLIHTELKNKWAFEKPYMSYAKESTMDALDSTINVVSSAEHAAMSAVGSAVKGTIEAAENLGKSTLDIAGKAVGKVASLLGEAIGLADTNEYLDAKNFKRDEKQWELTRAAEELERTRRMSDSLIDPMIDARKRRVEKELLRQVRSC